MSDNQLNVDFRFNTEESKKQTAEIRKDTESVNEAAKAGNKPLQEREGLLERLRRRMSELKVLSEKSTSFTFIKRANAQIESFQKDIDRLTKIGREGFDDMGKAIPDFNVPAGQLERLTYAANLYKKAINEAPNTEIITKYNRKLEETQMQMARMRNMGRQGFDEIGNKIVVANKATTGLVAGFGRAYTALSRLAYLIPGLGIAGLLALAWNPLKKLIDGMGLFSRSLSEAQKEANRLGEAMSGTEYKNAVEQMSELRMKLDLAKEGAFNKNEVLKQYNETVGKVAGQLKDFNEVEQAMIDNAESYIKMTLYKEAAQRSLAKAAESAIEAEKTRLKSLEDFTKTRDYSIPSNGMSVTGYVTETQIKNAAYLAEKAAQDRKDKEIAIHTKAEEEQLNISRSFWDKAKDEVNKMGGLLGTDKSKGDKSGSKEMDRSVSAAQSMYQKLADLKAEYARKSLSKDEEELQAVRYKFAKIAREIEVFNLNPKNKIKVEAEGLDDLRDQAIADLTYKQETEKLKIQLIEQKNLYQEYEEYKAALGKEKADEKYKELIDLEKTHLDNLKTELSKIDKDGGAEQARKEELEKRIKEEEKKEEQRLTRLLSMMVAYDQKRKEMIRKFEADRADIVGEASAEELKEFDNKHVEELNSLDDSHIQQLASYKELFEGIGKLSDMSAKRVIDNAKIMLAVNQNMSADEREKIEKAIAEAEESLNNRLYERVGKVGQEFQQIASSVSSVNKELADMLGLLSNVLKASVDISKGLSDLKLDIGNYKETKDAGGGILETISAVAGVAGSAGKIVGAVTSIVSGVLTINSRTKEMNRQARADVQRFYDEAMRGELDYIALQRSRELEQSKAGKNTYNSIRAQLELLKSQSPEIEKAYNKIFSALQGEEFISDQGYKHGTWFRKAKTWDIMASLAGSDYAKLEQLYSEGRLKDKAKGDFEALRKLKDELDQLGLSLEDLQADLNQLLTGADVNSLASGLAEMLANGKRHAEDFGASFEDIMHKAIRSSFEIKYLQDAMTPFYEELATMMESGALSESQIDALRKKYISIGEEYAKQWEDIEKITGKVDSSAASKGIGEIGRITEATAGRIESEMGGMRLAQLAANEMQMKCIEEQRVMFQRSLAVHLKIEEHTRNTALNTNRLAGIEKALLSMDKKMSDVDALRRGAGI